ncbi:MAG: 2-phospho-L-lactate transferase [Chloroflexi bacterium GWC2_73_18]|nr:MAG: 2-phospho-L-lactate transferase [Chloroflexi bacterium GWC2_73_18]
MARVVVLAGGTGGAKLAHGFDLALAAGRAGPGDAGGDDLTVIVNTGDDLELHGLHVSPDIDMVVYLLAGILDRERGWGLAGETWSAAAMLERYGAPTWFRLGDGDLATQVRRTERLHAGATLTAVTGELAAALGVRARILPMCDDPVRTRIRIDAGWLDFQEWFVRRRHADDAREVRLEGIARARPTREVMAAIGGAGLVVVGPSNPFVSIGPILAVPGLADALYAAPAPVVAVSPIVAGRAIKGPADRMLAATGIEVSAAGVAQYYAERYPRLLDGFVVDRSDAALAARIEALGPRVLVADTLMTGDGERARLASEIVAWGVSLARLA